MVESLTGQLAVAQEFQHMLDQMRHLERVEQPDERLETLVDILGSAVKVVKYTDGPTHHLIRDELRRMRTGDPKIASMAESTLNCARELIKTHPRHYFKDGFLHLK